MNHDNQKKTSFIYAFAGAGSGILTRAISQPFDVIKIRFQLQVEPIKSESTQSKYRSTLQCLTTIVKEEGVFGLWRGHVPAQFLSAFYGFVQFQTYESLKQELSRYPNKKEDRNYVNFLCGAASGCTATLFSFPFDVIRTRLVAQGNSKAYKGMTNGFVTLYKKEGMLGYFRGSSAALMVSGPFAGCQFLFYEFFKNIALSVDLLREENKQRKLIPSGELVCGSLSGVMSKLVTYPWDLVRKRLQLQSFQYARVGYGKVLAKKMVGDKYPGKLVCTYDDRVLTSTTMYVSSISNEEAYGRLPLHVKHVSPHTNKTCGLNNFTCKGLINCFKGTIEGENVFGLFKGLSPSLLKAGVTTALHFAIYEEILSKLR